MAFAQASGLSLHAWTPSIVPSGTNVTYTPRGTYVIELTGFIEGWNHTLAAVGGFWTATATFKARLSDAENWLWDGLSRHIELRSPSLGIAWEGFVNEVSLGVGLLSDNRGPVMDIINRGSAIYTTVDASTTPPTSGVTTSTVIEDDEDSKLKHGVLEGIMNLQQADNATAEDARDTWIAENRWPNSSKTLSIPSQTEVTVTLNCLGYVNFLSKAVYNQITNTGWTTISNAANAKLQSILGGTVAVPIAPNADPNNLFTVDNSEIFANATLALDFELANRTGWDIIQEMLAFGEPTDFLRTLFGVYAKRKVIYEVIPTSLNYMTSLRDRAQMIFTPNQEEVKPWNVDVGRWLMIADYLIGKKQPAALKEDQRNLFGEQVTFTAPYGISINSSKVQSLPQLLAFYGLGG